MPRSLGENELRIGPDNQSQPARGTGKGDPTTEDTEESEGARTRQVGKPLVDCPWIRPGDSPRSPFLSVTFPPCPPCPRWFDSGFFRASATLPRPGTAFALDRDDFGRRRAGRHPRRSRRPEDWCTSWRVQRGKARQTRRRAVRGRGRGVGTKSRPRVAGAGTPPQAARRGGPRPGTRRTARHRKKTATAGAGDSQDEAGESRIRGDR